MPTRPTTTVTVALLALLATGCAPSKVRVDKAPQAADTCKTFDWRRVSEQPESFTEQRVRDAALKELASKGYARAAEHPDCQITFAYTTSERRGSKPSVGVGVGGGSGGLGGGIGINLPVGKAKQAGEFSLDVIDAKTNSQIWHGSVEATSKSADLTEEEAARLVDTVLAKYPSRPKDTGH